MNGMDEINESDESLQSVFVIKYFILKIILINF